MRAATWSTANRAALSGLAILLAAAVPTSGQEAPTEESTTVVAHYEVPGGAQFAGTPVTGYFAVSSCDGGPGCVTFSVADEYSSFELEIIDDFGAVVHAVSATEGVGNVCSATQEAHALPVEIDELSFYVLAGTCDDGETISSPTSGTIRITFHSEKS